jgi:hypothetical protein
LGRYESCGYFTRSACELQKSLLNLITIVFVGKILIENFLKKIFVAKKTMRKLGDAHKLPTNLE